MTLCALLTEARTALDAVLPLVRARLPGYNVAIGVVPESPELVTWPTRRLRCIKLLDACLGSDWCLCNRQLYTKIDRLPKL